MRRDFLSAVAVAAPQDARTTYAQWDAAVHAFLDSLRPWLTEEDLALPTRREFCLLPESSLPFSVSGYGYFRAWLRKRNLDPEDFRPEPAVLSRPPIKPRPAARHDAILEDLEKATMLVSIVIRNAMEDFHADHLSDAQMRTLNPIIRNAVFTALHAIRSRDQSAGARGYLEYHTQHIPPYWERPELLERYARILRHGEYVDAN